MEGVFNTKNIRFCFLVKYDWKAIWVLSLKVDQVSLDTTRRKACEILQKKIVSFS